MSRANRLLDLLQALRRHRYPVSGHLLAQDLGISLRTLYRDIETLKAQGAHIEGEAGVGFVLRPGFMLPPLMFTPDEIEAIVLGSNWVAKRADAPLSAAAKNALAKIAAVMPDDLREMLDTAGVMVGPGAPITGGDIDLGVLRAAIRADRKLAIAYTDGKGAASERVIWPVALAFFDSVRVLVAWCETRTDFRHFRCDRIWSIRTLTAKPPKRRRALLKAWRVKEGVPEP